MCDEKKNFINFWYNCMHPCYVYTRVLTHTRTHTQVSRPSRKESFQATTHTHHEVNTMRKSHSSDSIASSIHSTYAPESSSRSKFAPVSSRHGSFSDASDWNSASSTFDTCASPSPTPEEILQSFAKVHSTDDRPPAWRAPPAYFAEE